MLIADFCREIETYLCRKNDGHLIRVVGPSFELVSRWAEMGVPLKVAFAGIDRYFERYYRKGPRRRPVKIDFCEADVLDVFDEWRRATGVTQATVDSQQSTVGSQQSAVDSRSSTESAGHTSLPRHLERAIARLTSARASGTIDAAFDALIDRVSGELDAARARSGGIRGDARRALIARLESLDEELMTRARAALDPGVLDEIAYEADAELAPFRAGMASEAAALARQRAMNRLVRERLGLPTIAYT